ncbi:MAG: hypothetical protein JWL95_2824, partial [Gemmatimonadetes bacterium]|nr:hypothetical protein [Gemmatimonadota bacterium]
MKSRTRGRARRNSLMRLHLLTTPDTAVRVRAALVGRPAEYLSFTPLRSTRPHWQRDPDVLVIELEACSPHAILSRLAEELPRYPHVGLVLAGRLTPALARLVTHLAQTTALSVTLHGSDTLADVWRAIRHACLLVLHERVLHALAPALVMVEYGVVQAIR